MFKPFELNLKSLFKIPNLCFLK
jgi:hypothetical protein